MEVPGAHPDAWRTSFGTRVVAFVAYGIALVILTAAPLGRLVQESGLPFTAVTGHDFGAYYRAAESVRDGAPPYLRETVAGPFQLNSWYYIYPPPFAGLILPITYLPPPAANVVWTVLLAAGMLVGGATIAGAGDPRKAHPPTAVAIGLAFGLSVPGISGMGQGAVSCLLGVLILGPLLATGARLAGIPAALAALAKIEPVLWGAYLVGAGKLRAVVVAICTGLGIIAATFALPGVRAGWVEYPAVLANAAASSRSVVGSGSLGALLDLAPSTSHKMETVVLGIALVLMFLAGRFGIRFAPLASVVGILATPTLWSHAVFMVVPGALLVIALGGGALVGTGLRRVALPGPRLAELLAVIFCFASYGIFLSGLDRFMVYLLALPAAILAAAWGPRKSAS